MTRLRKEQRKRQKAATRQVMALIPLATISLAQITTPSYALFTSKAVAASSFKAAFVFPKTVDDEADEACADDDRAEGFSHHANQTLEGGSDDSVDSKQYASHVQDAQQSAVGASQAASSAQSILSTLGGYFSRAQTELTTVQTSLNQLQSQANDVATHLTQEQKNLTDLQHSANQVQLTSQVPLLNRVPALNRAALLAKIAQSQLVISSLQQQADQLSVNIAQTQIELNSKQRVFNYVLSAFNRAQAAAADASNSAASAQADAAQASQNEQHKIDHENKIKAEQAAAAAAAAAAKKAKQTDPGSNGTTQQSVSQSVYGSGSTVSQSVYGIHSK